MRRRLLGSLAVLVAIVASGWFVARQSGPLYKHPILALRLIMDDTPGALPVPVTRVMPRQLVDTWGAPRSGGRQHHGIDIFAPRGRAIVSTTDGIVVTVGRSKLGGRIVRVLGPAGQWHYYAHLNSFGPIREGDVIRRGTLIGYVGDSGNARGTPTHLHYGIYRFHGGAINPYPILTAKSDS